MKKNKFQIISIIVVSVLMTSCGMKKTVDIQSIAEQNDGFEQTVISSTEPEDNNVSDGEADVDLTILSSTMVYSEVYNMMVTPNDYIGKTVKMTGVFAVYEDESTGNIYYACIIQDATACCSQGIEFVLEGDYVYPDDYPELGETITIEGEFETYTEGEDMYCRLKNAKML